MTFLLQPCASARVDVGRVTSRCFFIFRFVCLLRELLPVWGTGREVGCN